MEIPTFRLDEIDFHGPLSLILQLLTKNRIEIRDVKISVILEQYLEYLSTHMDASSDRNFETAGEFIVMAAHLAYLKTRAALDEGREISEIEQLLQSLETLKRREQFGYYSQLAARLNTIIRFDVFTKQPENQDIGSDYRYEIPVIELVAAYNTFDATDAALENRSERVRRSLPVKISYDVELKSLEIMELLRRVESIPITEVLSRNTSKSELVALFIAILELFRLGNLRYDNGIVSLPAEA